ncbi:hypothetical protein C8R43DRAFT_1236300 [Mycena crocata]|nr:hypothetical protein C8R43DRAFT_1236300 [Mycena crocata]
MATEAYPGLPTELERAIFELAALLCPGCMPALLLVAQRVKTWVEPILYRVLSFQSATERRQRRLTLDQFQSLFGARPAFIQRCAQRVWLIHATPTSADVRAVLSVCGALVDLCLPDVPESVLSLLQALPLQRLHIGFIDRYSILANPLFLQITHLSFGYAFLSKRADWDRLTGLSQLAHFSFSGDDCPPSACQRLLENCPRLKFLVNVHDENPDIDTYGPDYAALTSESRFVMLVVIDRQADWVAGARGGEDYWERAERLVLQRSVANQ